LGSFNCIVLFLPLKVKPSMSFCNTHHLCRLASSTLQVRFS
jgi:hypothetical protein